MRIFIVAIFFTFSLFSQNLDISLLRKINLTGSSSLDPGFRFITNSVAPLTIAAPVSFITIYFVKKNNTNKKNALFICSSVAISGIITTLTKYSVNRKRPFVTYPDIEKETSGRSPSFPSGHTSDAFSLASSLSIICPKWYVIAPSFIWASLVGYSRMDLGVHYPSDVLFGAIIGSGSAYLSYKINKWYFVRRQVTK